MQYVGRRNSTKKHKEVVETTCICCVARLHSPAQNLGAQWRLGSLLDLSTTNSIKRMLFLCGEGSSCRKRTNFVVH